MSSNPVPVTHHRTEQTKSIYNGSSPNFVSVKKDKENLGFPALDVEFFPDRSFKTVDKEKKIISTALMSRKMMLPFVQLCSTFVIQICSIYISMQFCGC